MLAVITGKDLEAAGLAWMPTLMSDTQMVLPIDHVVYQAQEVAAVIATDRYAAADAITLVEVEYEPLEPVIDPFKALEESSPLVRPDREDKTNHIWHWEAGDRAADRRRLPVGGCRRQGGYLHPAHPRRLDRDVRLRRQLRQGRGKLTIWMTTQAPHAIRTVFSLVSGIPEHKIRVISPDIGGGFGGKVPVYPGYVFATVAAPDHRPAGQVDRGPPREPAGRLLRPRLSHPRRAGGRQRRQDEGAAHQDDRRPRRGRRGGQSVEVPRRPLLHRHRLVRHAEAADVEVDGVYTNKPPGGVAYRCSFRVTEAVHTIERMVDLLALKLNMDPAELRMKNFIQPEQFPYKSPPGWEYDSGNYPAALKKALDKIGYAELRREQAEKRARGELMGIGLSTFTEIVGAGPSDTFDILGIKMFDSAEIRVHPTGSAIVRIGVQTPGPGPRDDVRPDRRRGAWPDRREHRSRARRHRYRAIRPGHVRQPEHADRWRGDGDGRAQDPRQGAHLAAHLLECSVDDLEWKDYKFQVKGAPEPLEDHDRAGLRRVHQPSAGDGGRPRGGVLLRSAQPDVPVRRVHLRRRHRSRHRRSQGAPLPGDRRLRHGHQPDDRRGPDPRRADDGHGAGAVRADLVRRGRQYARRHADGLPGADGDGDAHLGDRPDGDAQSRTIPFGAKGVGESATVGAPPAIVNAVVDALSHLGVTHVDIPITPWKVYQILQEHGAAEA